MNENVPEFVGVYREQLFSPGKVREDAAILDAALEKLSGTPGFRTRSSSPETLASHSRGPSFVLSMAQSQAALSHLEQWEKEGTRVVNSVQAVRNCYRKPLIRILLQAGLPVPPSLIVPLAEIQGGPLFEEGKSYWLKRGDVHAVHADDVVKVSSREDLAVAMGHFRAKGVDEVLVQEHVEGEVVKFYGIGQEDFFVAYLSPIGEEITDQVPSLSFLGRKAAAAVGLEIYGGDAVLTGEGVLYLIDLNDWPSFSRCCRPAAASIANYITRLCRGGTDELPGSF
jgi:glutathione synthase/RimK-type ligase-like ATP-grasp enzyme